MHGFRQRNGVRAAFESDKIPWRGEREEPVFIERQFLAMAPELVQVLREPAFAAALATKAIGPDAASAGDNWRAHQAVVERRGNHSGFTKPRGPGDDELGLIDGGVFLMIVGHT